jgi:hypothetical protein
MAVVLMRFLRSANRYFFFFVSEVFVSAIAHSAGAHEHFRDSALRFEGYAETHFNRQTAQTFRLCELFRWHFTANISVIAASG